ncbi:MAG: T9SS type A sorting domain-containing protein [candidate division KSB1 bacterium]|nr:T9SS type A sorting domain-containing protein [candidate division KSB1 bacterium]MDZ7305296.1 T9SS type A sorting domain-containing protein [candidate division KSB1 bacterium]MDZ7314389.1 T9SS type A sorting domain-containing protein [candidate division KSB1 bacterium]
MAPNIGLLEETGDGDDNFLVGTYIKGKLLGDTTLTSIKEIAQPNLLLHPALSPTYPNPFNNTTHITYYIPEFWTEPIQISVFDISGREIAILVQERSIRGSHEVLWNGKNKQGKEVSNGIYIIRLTSGQFSQTIKLNYLR